jgi:hypothetical protein
MFKKKEPSHRNNHIQLNEKTYEVFILSSPLPFPFNFAVHTWVVTNRKGETNRWEVWQHKNAGPVSWGHVHKNLFPLFTGMNVFYILTKKRFRSKIIYKMEGDEGSQAHKLISFIENKAHVYSFRSKYRYVPGPNSNTFTQWIIDQMDSKKVKLQGNAFGKGYARHIK